VVVGGLLVSTLFTLFLVPAVLSLTLDLRASGEAWLHRLVRNGRGAAPAG
jgi:hypothetical protein